MSDTMLHAVLNIPPDLWQDGPIDRAQRHARCVEASARIVRLERELASANADLDHTNQFCLDVMRERDEALDALREMRDLITRMNFGDSYPAITRAVERADGILEATK
jgi:hypothetical protein